MLTGQSQSGAALQLTAQALPPRLGTHLGLAQHREWHLVQQAAAWGQPPVQARLPCWARELLSAEAVAGQAQEWLPELAGVWLVVGRSPEAALCVGLAHGQLQLAKAAPRER